MLKDEWRVNVASEKFSPMASRYDSHIEAAKMQRLIRQNPRTIVILSKIMLSQLANL